MRKIILLVFLFFIINAKAQQRELDSLLNELKNRPQLSDTNKINLYNAIGMAYAEIDPVKGLSFSNEAIAKSNKISNKNFLAKSYNVKATNLMRQGNLKEAKDLLQSDLNFYQHSKNLHQLAIIYHNLASVYFYLSDYGNAIKYDLQTENIFTQLHDDKQLAASIINTGVDYLITSDFPTAMNHFETGLATAEKIKDSGTILKAYANIIEVYNGMNDFPNALTYGLKALDLSKKLGNIYLQIQMTASVGQIYYYMNNNTEALKYYNEAFAKPELENYLPVKAFVYDGFGMIYSKQKKYEAGLKYLTGAKNIFEKLGDKLNLSGAINEIGKIYMYVGDSLQKKGVNASNSFNIALSYQQDALQLANETNTMSRKLLAWQSISEIYEKQKLYNKAYDALQKTIVYKDSIVNDTSKQKITQLQSQFQFNKTEDSIKVINDQKQIIAKAELNKERVVKNSILAGSGFLLLAGIGGFTFYKRNLDIKTQKNEAELKAHISDTEMKALRAQMNPHFIFNSLNSIVDYIDKHQTTTATEYTTKFAKLMRVVLENSEEKEISLSDDLNALEMYMQLENLRLQNKFSFEIIVDETIDKENVLVPPLILQPFVENAIWHGIAGKQEKGKIKIMIQQQGEMINCIVEDDGIGLMNKNDENQAKKSLGMKITKARIDILNQQKKANATVTIFDKRKGVRAEIKLPLELSL